MDEGSAFVLITSPKTIRFWLGDSLQARCGVMLGVIVRPMLSDGYEYNDWITRLDAP